MPYNPSSLLYHSIDKLSSDLKLCLSSIFSFLWLFLKNIIVIEEGSKKKK